MCARILIVEDNPDNLELMTYLLRAFGHTTFAAEDGRHGLEIAGREQPDLIICDIQLPLLDGYEVARQLKKDARLQSIPLVAVTALAMVGDRDRVLAAGFDGYVTKPIAPELFVAQLEEYLRSRRTARSPEGTPTTNVDAPATTTSAPSGVAEGPRLLVVDNLPVNLELKRSILEPSGYQVTTATGLAEGLAQVREGSFDMIISDICMNDGSGYDFVQAVRADPKLRDLPFIFITSTYLDEKDRRKGLALGADLFLWRPIEPEALLAEIAGCFHRKGGARSWRPS